MSPDVVAALEAATEGSEDLDRLIYEAMGAEEFFGCTYVDSDMPAFSTSVDAALTLVPKGWYWRAGRTTLFSGWAFIHQTHPDQGELGKNEFAANKEHRCGEWTPALALCLAALRATRHG